MFKNTVYFLSMLCGLLINLSVIAATPKTYPPYSDVWGYDLSTLPAIKWGSASVEAYPMDDGDIWFIITHSYKTTPSMDTSENELDSKYVLIKFFKKEQVELSEKQAEEIIKIVEKQKPTLRKIYDEVITFNDNSKLQFCPNHTSVKLFSPNFYNRYFLKTDPQGQQKKYSILAASPQVRIYLDGGLGEIAGGPLFYQKLYMLRSIIPLKDDTFIVFENGSNLILRFNKDFETKFKPVTPVRVQGNYIMRNFFVIDYSVIEKLEAEYLGQPVPFYQNIHDALLNYLHKKYVSSN